MGRRGKKWNLIAGFIIRVDDSSVYLQLDKSEKFSDKQEASKLLKFLKKRSKKLNYCMPIYNQQSINGNERHNSFPEIGSLNAIQNEKVDFHSFSRVHINICDIPSNSSI